MLEDAQGRGHLVAAAEARDLGVIGAAFDPHDGARCARAVQPEVEPRGEGVAVPAIGGVHAQAQVRVAPVVVGVAQEEPVVDLAGVDRFAHRRRDGVEQHVVLVLLDAVERERAPPGCRRPQPRRWHRPRAGDRAMAGFGAQSLGRVGEVDQRDHRLDATAVAVDGAVERRPDLPGARLAGEIAPRLRGIEIDWQQLVLGADLHETGRRGCGGAGAARAPPATERARIQVGRQPPAGRRDHEAVDRHARDIRQVGERAQRERPGGVLPVKGEAGEQPEEPGRRGRRAHARQRRGNKLARAIVAGVGEQYVLCPLLAQRVARRRRQWRGQALPRRWRACARRHAPPAAPAVRRLHPLPAARALALSLGALADWRMSARVDRQLRHHQQLALPARPGCARSPLAARGHAGAAAARAGPFRASRRQGRAAAGRSRYPQASRSLRPAHLEIWPPLDRTVDRDRRRIEAVVALVDLPDAAEALRAEARHRAVAGAGGSHRHQLGDGGIRVAHVRAPRHRAAPGRRAVRRRRAGGARSDDAGEESTTGSSCATPTTTGATRTCACACTPPIAGTATPSPRGSTSGCTARALGRRRAGRKRHLSPRGRALRRPRRDGRGPAHLPARQRARVRAAGQRPHARQYRRRRESARSR